MPTDCIRYQTQERHHELRQTDVDLKKTGSEMADIVLRVMDLAGEMGMNLGGKVFDKISFNHENIEHHKAKGRAK